MKFLRFPLQIKTGEIRPVTTSILLLPWKLIVFTTLRSTKGDNGVQEESSSWVPRS